MSTQELYSTRFTGLSAFLLIVLGSSISCAQDQPSATGAKSAAKMEQTTGTGESEFSDRLKLAETKKTPSGRLPRYFAAVVDQKQRLKIYEIQSIYRTKIAEIQRQLEELQAAQMNEVEQVLTASQLKRVEELRAQPRSMPTASAGKGQSSS